MLLHGQRSQPERDEAMLAFRSGKCQVRAASDRNPPRNPLIFKCTSHRHYSTSSQIMVATDVAARGLDIRSLPYVVNYDFPSSLATCIHRVGWTGSLASDGHAFGVFTRTLAKISGPLVKLLSAHGQTLDPNLVQLASAWREAVAKAGGEAELEARINAEAGKGPAGKGDGEESFGEEEDRDRLDELMEERMQAADISEGLRNAGILRKKKAKKGSSKSDGVNARLAAGAEEPLLSMQQRLSKAKTAGVAEAVRRASAAEPSLAFSPSAKFVGARSGYVFKKGPLGLGYYRDAAKPRAAVPKAAAAAALQRCKGPIIPSGKKRVLDVWSDEDDEDEEDGGSVDAPDIEGRKGLSKSNATAKRRKALPGRLRKKLRKDQVGRADKIE